ncbi:MAG: hypothetical protein LAO03_18615 [Acidobacteriia bacterium]|nr:hypothetical protein [Terriglobia bacterium]
MPENAVTQPIETMRTESPRVNLRTMRSVQNAVEDTVNAARRTLRHGRHSAEDLVEEAAHEVKRHPLATVAMTFGVAFVGGVLLGWIAAQASKR